MLPDAGYDKHLFQRKLTELGLMDGFCEQLFPLLGRPFHACSNCRTRRRSCCGRTAPAGTEFEKIAEGVLALAKANYEIAFTPDQDISERVIFPYSPTESNGIEDARFVRFTDEDGSARYYATYSAYDGKMVLPQILETTDFLHFKISTLNGPEVRDKGFALFPRKINGLYAMLSRQDGENMYLMYSDMIHFWYTKQLLLKPAYPWEYVQVGNCGSPIETEAGWLVLTHGVGPDAEVLHRRGAAGPRRPGPGDRPLEPAAAGSQRERARGLRAERGLQLRGAGAQRRADHPLRHGRLRHHLRHGAAGGPAHRDERVGLPSARHVDQRRLALLRLVVGLDELRPSAGSRSGSPAG